MRLAKGDKVLIKGFVDYWHKEWGNQPPSAGSYGNDFVRAETESIVCVITEARHDGVYYVRIPEARHVWAINKRYIVPYKTVESEAEEL